MTTPTAYTGPPATSKVLIVDDEEVIRHMLTDVLREDYSLATVQDAEEALDFLKEHPADVALVDKNLPGVNGLELTRLIKEMSPETEVIVVTGYASLESAVESLRVGAYDYLQKPFDDISIISEKVRRAAEKKELAQEHRQLMDQLLASNQELRLAHDRLRQGYLETLTSMIAALEARDAYTRGHSDRVSVYAVTIAEEMDLPSEDIQRLRDGARLHDLGKIGVREEVLNKAGKLTDAEYDHIKEHPAIGSDIIGKMEAYRHLLPMVRYHHERWDGRGYPEGIAGEAIPLFARIIAVADCFDAMTSKRPYRDPRTVDKALKVIAEVSGTQLDPGVVGAFLMAHKRGAIQLSRVAGQA